MKSQQQGYLLIAIAFILLVLSLVAGIALQSGQTSLASANDEFALWKINAVAESYASTPYIRAARGSVLSPSFRDNQVKVFQKNYRLDANAGHILPATLQYYSHTNMYEKHIVTFSIKDELAYQDCITKGFTEEITRFPKADIDFNEDPTKTLTACLRSKNIYYAHVSKTNYGELPNYTIDRTTIVE